ncbi:MAG: hypothetical protein HN855_00545 [Anaerolineae bacterium]|jgi:hypothetical protein|nr:hypothetical protein [Anaerolineae bacterium]MBT7069689.1 hypothetical protein [Anaerolineae bacterium]MBT7323629.1 hypothetical protein [Anaerolineae bacterium]
MFKKIAIGLLLTTVLGAGGAAAAYQASVAEENEILATPEVLSQQEQAQGFGNAEQGQQGEPAQAMVAEGSQGEPWLEVGTITEIDDTGFQFSLQTGESVYVELGPPDYWQAQGITLEAGQTVIVDGSINEGMIHATQVFLSDGQILQVRSETGQPLWSGGVDNAQGQSNGEQTGEPQILVDEWITYEGSLMSFQGGNMTMSTADGEIIAFQTGQPRFFAEQGVTFQVGDEIIVVGFYQNDQFSAGDITQVSTGARVMLRDPNGRPLWAGPGNGNK